MAGLIKVLLSYEHQTLPANLHFHTPNPNNAGLKDGILKVVTEPTEFKQGITALSNFGFGGLSPSPYVYWLSKYSKLTLADLHSCQLAHQAQDLAATQKALLCILVYRFQHSPPAQGRRLA